MSKEHTSMVSLVLSPKTRLVSPQFHVKWDDKFETVNSDPMMKEVGKWQEITGIHRTKQVKEAAQIPRPNVRTTMDELQLLLRDDGRNQITT